MIPRSFRWTLPVGVSCLLVLPLLGQTSSTSWEVRADNDYFNFWQSAGARPDWEYTHGMEISGTWSAQRLPLPHVLPERPTCADASATDRTCTRVRLAIGQEIYTPEIDFRQLLPGDRPYAGWLYASFSESVESRDGLDEVRATVGVTGAPSLAETVQDTWHRWLGIPKRVGWSGQIPFEPDFSVRWTHARELVPRDSRIASVLHAAPFGVAEVGTLATSLTAGGSVTVGLNPRGRHGSRPVAGGAGGRLRSILGGAGRCSS